MLSESSPPTILIGLPPGREGTKHTLYMMRKLVRQGKKSPMVRQLAVELTQGLEQKNWIGEIDAIHKFVRDRIRFVKDIRGVETLHTVEKILNNSAGDCDDKSILASALLESLGHPTRLVAIGFNKGIFSHVYPETRIGDKWVTLETTEPVPLGWKPENIVNVMILNN